MSDMFLSTGDDSSYLVYPPGFHVLTAEISRLSGVEPLKLYSLVVPAILVLPALSGYALVRRLWGWRAGIVAAFFAGLMLGSTYYFFNLGMYPNMVGVDFLLVLAVAALFGMYSCAFRAGRTASGAAVSARSCGLLHRSPKRAVEAGGQLCRLACPIRRCGCGKSGSGALQRLQLLFEEKRSKENTFSEGRVRYNPENASALSSELKGHKRVWVVSKTNVRDPSLLRRVLEKRYDLAYHHKYYGLQLDFFKRRK